MGWGFYRSRRSWGQLRSEKWHAEEEKEAVPGGKLSKHAGGSCEVAGHVI